MVNAGVIDPVLHPAPPDPNQMFEFPSGADPSSLFDGLGFDNDEFDFNQLDNLSIPEFTDDCLADLFDFDSDEIGCGSGMDFNSQISVEADHADGNLLNNNNNCVSDEKLVRLSGGSDEDVGNGIENENGSPSGENGPVSSHGSGGEAVNVIYWSPEDLSNFNGNATNDSCAVFDYGIEGEEERVGKRGVAKRKKEGVEGKVEMRSSKMRKAGGESEICVSSGNEDDERKRARMMRNRESAQASRMRKKQYVEELEEKLRAMHSTITDLNGRISYVMAENASLRQQLSGGMYPPPPGMYPPGHMAYPPWMPYSPYAMKPHGSQVPLVPIPRLKPRQPSKPKSNTKKVASVSLLGLLFFLFLFGALVPMMNTKYEGAMVHIRNQQKDRILAVDGHRSGSDLMVPSVSTDGLGSYGNGMYYEKGRSDEKEDVLHGEPLRPRNSTEPLLASLYVPRNDKLVKIDGNLIIHSVLASEKAMESYKTSEILKGEKLSTALVSHSSPGLTYSEAERNRHRHPNAYRNPSERQRSLDSGTSDASLKHVDATLGDGKLQQWFREGLAGPMLTSGMCTEVFQFETSPVANPGAIVPASSVAKRSAEQQNNSTHINRMRNRRALNSLPAPDTKSTLNDTNGNMGKGSHRDILEGNKTQSPMIVSILVDPREEIDSMIEPKSFSRIFVVVLLDSVKYVTYSCMLPVRGFGSSQVVTA